MVWVFYHLKYCLHKGYLSFIYQSFSLQLIIQYMRSLKLDSSGLNM